MKVLSKQLVRMSLALGATTLGAMGLACTNDPVAASGYGYGGGTDESPGMPDIAVEGCGSELAMCGDDCVDLEKDRQNCGSCGTVCESGYDCVAGNCEVLCMGGSSSCNGECVDLQNDPANCGSCGSQCGDGTVCSFGQCDLKCSGETVECNGGCVDLRSNPDNCGSCGNECAEGLSCVDGSCELVCNGGTTACDEECVDLDQDPENCGACGHECLEEEVCSQGSCSLECVGGTSLCEDRCVDLNNDHGNCGACGNNCASGQICSEGACEWTCGEGLTACTEGCVDLQEDPAHCGECENVCVDGTHCVEGSCENFFPDSDLIDPDEADQINDWVGTPGQQWVRCYSRLHDGAGPNRFHAGCDGKAKTVTVAMLNTDKKIGGYSVDPWTWDGLYTGDPNSFLFSLTNRFKHESCGGGGEGCCYEGPSAYETFSHFNYGPTFGGGHDWANDTTYGYCDLGHTFECRIGDHWTPGCANDFCGSYTGWEIVNMEVWYPAPAE